MDNHIEYDQEYFNYRVSKVMEYSKITRGDFAKIYLYILEREMFPEIESSFKSVDYIREDKIQKSIIDMEFSKIYKLVCDIYENDYEISNGKRI